MSDDDQGPNPRRALVGLLAIVVLIGGVLFIMYRLNQAAQLQDCVASGRTNCAPIETSAAMSETALAADCTALLQELLPKVAFAIVQDLPAK